MAKKQKQKTIFEETCSQRIWHYYESTYSTGFMKENPGKASQVAPPWHLSFTEAGTG